MTTVDFRQVERQLSLGWKPKLASRPDQVFVIHYSCESLTADTGSGRTPRVTCIAVRNFGTGELRSFSISSEAEICDLRPADAVNSLDDLELRALNRFYAFVAANPRCYWVHWRMRSQSFGFYAIEHRYLVLGGSRASEIGDEWKVDLAKTLAAVFGDQFAKDPKLRHLAVLNDISTRDMLDGPEEPVRFRKGEYIALRASTERKVLIISCFLRLFLLDTLKTDAGVIQKHGLTWASVPKIVQEHPIILGLSLFSLLAGILDQLDEIREWLGW
jgi:hypothetical protein